jgi:serine/threonine protein kinase
LGARHYSAAVDVWAAGCVIAQLVTLSPLFPGESDIDQLFRVIGLLGSPHAASVWPGVEALPDFHKISSAPSECSDRSLDHPLRSAAFVLRLDHTANVAALAAHPGILTGRSAPLAWCAVPDCPPTPLRVALPAASRPLLRLLQQMLYYDPERRPTARRALDHDWLLRPHPSAHVHLPPTHVARVVRQAAARGVGRSGGTRGASAQGGAPGNAARRSGVHYPAVGCVHVSAQPSSAGLVRDELYRMRVLRSSVRRYGIRETSV